MEPTLADGSASTSQQSFYPFPRDFADNLSFPIGCTVVFRDEHGKSAATDDCAAKQWKWGRVKEVGIDRHNNYDSQVCFKVQERSSNKDSWIVLGKNMLLAPRSRVWVVSSSKRDGSRTKQRGIVLRATTANQATTTTNKVQYTVQVPGGRVLSNVDPKDVEFRRETATSESEQQTESSTTTVSENYDPVDTSTTSQIATTQRVEHQVSRTKEQPTYTPSGNTEMGDQSPPATNQDREDNPQTELPSDDHQGDNIYSTCPIRIKQEDVIAEAAPVSGTAHAGDDNGIAARNEAGQEPQYVACNGVTIKREEDPAEAAETDIASARLTAAAGSEYVQGTTLEEARRKQSTLISTYASMDASSMIPSSRRTSTTSSVYTVMSSSTLSDYRPSTSSSTNASSTNSRNAASTDSKTYTPTTCSTHTTTNASSTFASMASSTVSDYTANTSSTFASMASSTISDYAANTSPTYENNTSSTFAAMSSAAVNDLGLSGSTSSSEATTHTSSRASSTGSAAAEDLGTSTSASPNPITTTTKSSRVTSYNTQANPFRHFVPGTCHRVGMVLKTLKRQRQPPPNNNNYAEEGTTTDMDICNDLCLHYHVHGVCRYGDYCKWFHSHRDLTTKEARDVEYALFPAISPDGPICSRRRYHHHSPQQQPKRTRKAAAAASPPAGSWRDVVNERSEAEDMGAHHQRAADHQTRKTRRVSYDECHQEASETPTKLDIPPEIGSPKQILGASASAEASAGKRKEGKGTVRKATAQVAGTHPKKRRRASFEQAPSSTVTNQVPVTASSTRYFLPVLEFGPAFFQKVLARKAERIGEKFGCVLELHGSALGPQLAEETQKRLDLFVRIVGDPSKLAPCKAAVKRTLVHAMESNLKGFLVFRLSMINHRSENRMLMIKNPSFVGLGTDDTDAQFLTCLKVKSKRSLDRVSQGLDTLECDHSSCSLDVFRRSKVFPNVKPFVLIAGANVHDVSDCQQAVERCMREH